MDIADKNEGRYGDLHIGIVTNVDTEKFRARVKYLETGGSPQSVVFNPSATGGNMPMEGELCLVYRVGQFYARYIMSLGMPIPEEELSLEDRVTKQEELTGDLPKLLPGESFIGSKGKVHFNNNGDIRMYTQSGGQQINISERTAKVSVSAHNYTLSTQGAGIAIRTKSSVPTTFGDILRLEKNVPAPLIPEEIGGGLTLPTNLSLIELDALGGITASVLAGGELILSEIGGVRLANTLGSFNIHPDGEIVVFSAKNASLEGLLTVQLTGNKPGFSVLLNPKATPAQQRGVARVDDFVTSTSTVDPLFWAYLQQLTSALFQLELAIASAPTNPGDGGAAFKAALVAAIGLFPAPPIEPAYLLSKITTGSITVTAGG